MTGGVRKRGNNWYYYFDLGKVDGKTHVRQLLGILAS